MDSTLLIGCNPSINLIDALHALSRAGFARRYALISLIDSTPHVRKLPSTPARFREMDAFCAEAGEDIVVELSKLLALHEQSELLTGFDELWLLEDVPSTGKPESFRITSDVPFEDDAPDGLAEWMVASHVAIGLGDGVGLNFVTFDSRVADLLETLRPI